MRFDSKVSTLEDRENLDKLTVNELHGIVTSYEMRTWQENPSKREATFKVSKESMNDENESKENNSDEEEAKCIRKLKKGSGKYKGKLPLKCFNYGKIGHFASKCPYPKQEDSDDEESYNPKQYNKGVTRYKKKSYKKNKNLYSKEDNCSSNESEDYETKLLFMGIENTCESDHYEDEENLEEEVEVDLEGELISALEELRKNRKKSKALKT